MNSTFSLIQDLTTINIEWIRLGITGSIRLWQQWLFR